MIIPSLDIIKSFLNKKLPVVIGVRSKVLFEEKRGKRFKAGHCIVLTDYEDGKFYYNDPSDGKAKSISADNDKLIFALSTNVLDSSAYLLVIKPLESLNAKN